MKIIFTAAVAVLTAVTFAQQGTLSYNFGDSGEVIIKKTNYCQSVALQGDGKILLGGYSGLVRLKRTECLIVILQ